MIISIPKEITPSETRIAASPEAVKRYINMGAKVQIESGAGDSSGFSDELYREAGADIITHANIYRQANIILKIQAPLSGEISKLQKGQTIIADFTNTHSYTDFATKNLTCFALEKIPRISRAQSMDILSSQNNLAGYKAVIKAAEYSVKSFPLLMTSAGTLAAAKVFVLGVGVAGLQAIATAKRLGAKVYASDIRPETQEQVQSLGARFIESHNILSQLKETDILITAAQTLTPKAPRLISEETLKQIKPNCVIIDLAAAKGGNVEGSKEGQIIKQKGLTLIGASRLATELPYAASNLFSQNILNFMTLAFNSQTHQFNFDFNDEIIKSTCIIKNGHLNSEDIND